MNNFNSLNNTTRSVNSAEYDQGLRSYMLRIYNYMTLALALTGVVAYYVSTNDALMTTIFNTPLQWVVFFAPLGILYFLSSRVHKMSFATAQLWFWIYSAVNGISLAIIFRAYAGEDIARAFFITSATFASLSLYGYTTKRDLSGWGKFLFIGLVGSIIALVVNLLLLKSSALQFGISVVFVFVFAGLTVYDTQRLKQLYFQLSGADQEFIGKTAILGALRLYLDFLNLFLLILRFVGGSRD